MRCPDLIELAVVSEKKGWPWTIESEQLAKTMQKGSGWPMISIVTPSFNQGQFIEETIRSVLLQGYPNIEYIIIDGGSTDGSVEIIKKYSKWIKYWVSEPDSGQSNAINKGFAQASGEIFAYINSDDLYDMGAFKVVAAQFMNSQGLHLLAGECIIFDENKIKRVFKPWWPRDVDHFLKPFGSTFAQPASFWSRAIYTKVGGFDERYHYCFDREFFLKIALAGFKAHLISEKLARYRDHAKTKTSQTIKFYEEAIPLVNQYWKLCRIQKSQRNTLVQQNLREIDFIKIFITWKKSGRLPAIIKALIFIIKTPNLILKRRILGLVRRLLFFYEKNVAELKNV